jgi:hypothetical protein
MNQAVNFFWTILCFIPVIAYWFAANSLLWCFIFIGISVVSQFLPVGQIQLSHNPRFYENFGVKFIRKFVQNGEFINRLIRKAKPNYRIIKSKANAMQYMKTIKMNERYHFICFVFFSLTAMYALITSHYTLSMLVIIANIIYNIYPILLQQYNRARVSKLMK